MATPTDDFDAEQTAAFMRKKLLATGFLNPNQQVIDREKLGNIQIPEIPSYIKKGEIDPAATASTTTTIETSTPKFQEEQQTVIHRRKQIDYNEYLAKMDKKSLDSLDRKYFGKVTIEEDGDESGDISNDSNESDRNLDETTDDGDDTEDEERKALLAKRNAQQQKQNSKNNNNNNNNEDFTLAQEVFPIHYKPQGQFPCKTFWRSVMLFIMGMIFVSVGIYRYIHFDDPATPMNPAVTAMRPDVMLNPSAAAALQQDTQPQEIWPLFLLAFFTLAPSCYQFIMIICAFCNFCDLTYNDIPNQ